MKKFIIALWIVIIATCLTSCGSNTLMVKAVNGIKLKAINTNNLVLRVGDTVHIRKIGTDNLWEIVNDGELIDTFYIRDNWSIQHKIAVVLID